MKGDRDCHTVKIYHYSRSDTILYNDEDKPSTLLAKWINNEIHIVILHVAYWGNMNILLQTGNSMSYKYSTVYHHQVTIQIFLSFRVGHPKIHKKALVPSVL